MKKLKTNAVFRKIFIKYMELTCIFLINKKVQQIFYLKTAILGFEKRKQF